MSHKKLGIMGAIAIVAVGLSLPAQAQGQWNWPEKPENLQVLPQDWPGSRLRPVMQGFSRALGVRCSHCHTGVEGQPLSTYDFASDENPNTERAREYLTKALEIFKRLGTLIEPDKVSKELAELSEA